MVHTKYKVIRLTVRCFLMLRRLCWSVAMLQHLVPERIPFRKLRKNIFFGVRTSADETSLGQFVMTQVGALFTQQPAFGPEFDQIRAAAKVLRQMEGWLGFMVFFDSHQECTICEKSCLEMESCGVAFPQRPAENMTPALRVLCTSPMGARPQQCLRGMLQHGNDHFTQLKRPVLQETRRKNATPIPALKSGCKPTESCSKPVEWGCAVRCGNQKNNEEFLLLQIRGLSRVWDSLEPQRRPGDKNEDDLEPQPIQPNEEKDHRLTTKLTNANMLPDSHWWPGQSHCPQLVQRMKKNQSLPQAHLLRHAVQPHPLLPVILPKTEELFIGEHDALHVNTRATFHQYPSLPEFQTWKKLLAKGTTFLLVGLAQAKRAHLLYCFLLELRAQVTTDRGPQQRNPKSVVVRTLRMAICTVTMCQQCFLAMAAVRKPAARSAFKRASVVAVHPAPLPMSVASKEKHLGFCVEHEPNKLRIVDDLFTDWWMDGWIIERNRNQKGELRMDGRMNKKSTIRRNRRQKKVPSALFTQHRHR